MKLLTAKPLVDKLIFRCNRQDIDYFRSLFFALEFNWYQIPFRNQERVEFDVISSYPSPSDRIRDPDYHEIDPPEYPPDYEGEIDEPDYPWNISVISLPRPSTPHYSLSGYLSKKGKEYAKNYLLKIPDFGNLYVVFNSITFTLHNHFLLRAQATPGGLERLINRIYIRLWNMFGLWFWISDLDISLDVAADRSVMDDLRLSQHWDHRLLTGSFTRHSVLPFIDSRRTDENGINFGKRNSKVHATIYDRDVMLSNAKGHYRSRLQQQRRILIGDIYSRSLRPGQHVVRTEFKLRNLFVFPPTGDDSRPVLSHVSNIPSKNHWRRNRSYRRVFFNQLDLPSIVSNLLQDCVLLRSDLSPFKVRHRDLVASHSMTRDNLRKIRQLDPDRFVAMLHPYYRFLVRSVAAMQTR